MGFNEISPSEFFYRNRDLAGFTNPVRALYFSLKELIENSLDSCESGEILPELFISIEVDDDGPREDPRFYRLTVQDNGMGVPAGSLPDAFGRIFYGNKFRLKQSRGVFGMGATMTLLYAQATTGKPSFVASSTTGRRYHGLLMKVDIERNRPIIIRKYEGKAYGWRGTLVRATILGDYQKAESKVMSYLEQTAMAAPYASITFRDPQGHQMRLERVVDRMPKPPRETLPHPSGVDIETLRKMIRQWRSGDMLKFMTKNFQRVGPKTAEVFLRYAGLDSSLNPRSLGDPELTRLAAALRSYGNFLPPDANYLSTLGHELLEAGVRRLLNPEFCRTVARRPQAYEGHPFIIEAAVAYGGPKLKPGITVFRFANRIPLLYDESSDVTWKVLNSMDLRSYRVRQEDPVGVIVHVISTRIPYKTIGKEYIADRPEVEREIRLALRDAFRELRNYLSRKERMVGVARRANVYSKYMSLIAKFSMELAERDRMPKYDILIPKGMEQDIEEAQQG
ncbi:MAG: DNA topoisomerase VI subunit B [Conexivisphaerales archaeon]|jgi:DNA topoisomerase-6 subunit B|nr:DNA topoisomerase VI subunit B [Conexivisphaerales archaeon]PMP94332.1 MAG: DNA topoisomerase VI subunit B [Nitrososphaera sp.]